MKKSARLLLLLAGSSVGLAALDHYAAPGGDAGRKDRSTHAVAATPVLPASAVRPALLRELEALKLARAQPPAAELFPAKSWQPPPPPAPPPPPPPPPAPVAPSAPPLPFIFMGRMFDADPPVVFLVKGERAYLVAQGDMIDDTYRLEKVETGQLTLRYLPLDAVQTLPVGERQ